MILRRRIAGGRLFSPSRRRDQLPPSHIAADRPVVPALGQVALVSILLLPSFGCQSPGEHSDAPASQAAALVADMSDRASDGAYPDLHSVPPRPELSYPVVQQREIAGELRADLANARYTDQVIRYRAGLSSLPPPPEPPTPPRETAEEPVAEAAPPPPEPDVGQPGPDVVQPEPMEEQASPRSVADLDRGTLDDGSLDDMIDDMVVDTEEPSDDEFDEDELAPAAGPIADTAPEPDAAPPEAEGENGSEMGDESGPVNRLFDWLSGVFDEGEGEASMASGAAGRGRPLLVASRADPPGVPRPIEPAAGAAPEAGSAPPEGRSADPAEPPVMTAAARPAAEAWTVTVTTSGIALAATAPAPDPELDAIAFAAGSAALTPQALRKLERFLAGAAIEGNRVTVLGEGSPPALAIDRARAVGQALVRLGMSADRLRISMATDGAGDRARLVVAGYEGR